MPADIKLLSPRELQIFLAIGAGYSSKQIAISLDCSPKTIETHRVNIKQKLGAKTVYDLQYLAIRHVVEIELQKP